MLSKKMAVSLTSLITIFALAFAVPSAMAGDFATTLTVGGHDISHADGEQRVSAAELVFNVTFGQIVTTVAASAAAADEEFASGDLIMQAYNEDGAVVATPTAVIAAVAPLDGKNYSITMTPDAGVSKLYLQIPQGKVGAADPTVADADDANAKAEVTVTFLIADPTTGGPDVLKIARVGEPFVTVTSAEFMVHVLLSEDAKGGLITDLIDVGDTATVNSVLKLASPAGTVQQADIGIIGADGNPVTAGTVADLDTWRDGEVHLYLVTIGTKPGDKTVTIKVKDFAGMERPAPGTAQEMYIRAADSALVEGRSKLTVMTKRDDPPTALADGHVVELTNKRVIPAGGYLIVATDPAMTGINLPTNADADDNTPKINERTPAELKYNAIKVALPNLEAFLANGGTIDLVAPDAGLMISEIMWGSDASLETNSNSQWIEIKNTTSANLATGDKTYKLIFYGPNEAVPAKGADGSLPTGVQDRVGTITDAGRYWSLADNKGRSGRTGTGESAKDIVAVVPTQSLISMYRVMDAAGAAVDGNTAAAWMQSTPPAINFDPGKGGNRIASPGASIHTFTPEAVQPPDPTPATPIPGAMASDIKITEIMVDTGAGRFPQWIELTSVATGKVSLDGWEMVIDNAIDTDVLGGGNAITVSLSGVTLDVSKHEGNLGKGQSALVVAWAAQRQSANIGAERVINVATQLGQTRRYQLLSYNGFRITLVPPDQGAIAAFGDIAGNLDEDWELPMNGRSSLIRREMDDAGMAIMGTDANGWALASSTNLVIGQPSYYGDDEDQGTPGHDSGGPLPVELSHFRPVRDKATGAVVITWSTQSELNNAGFFIKRSQQRNGEFKVINAAMVQGAGTTSEKQFYTYTDTTAQPNVVYYYQIEDVSLDGNRQLLTRGIRLKGHVSAAGKATTLWGELKTSHE